MNKNEYTCKIYDSLCNEINDCLRECIDYENIDYIISAPTLPGVPDNAIILDVAVGESYINSFKLKYSL